MNTEIENASDWALMANMFLGGILTTLIAIFAVLGLRFFLVRMVKGKVEILGKDQWRWINRINNGATILMLVCLFFIWAPQLHSFALSLTAVAVAIVLTTKELLMCLTGGFLRTTTKPFDIGDWINVDGQTGEVMRITAMTTMIQEVNVEDGSYQFSGRTIQIPNSKFLSHSVENSNFIKKYVYLDIPITLQYADMDPAVLIKKLQSIAKKHYAPFLQNAVAYNKKIEKRAAVDFCDPEPQFFLKTTEIGHNIYTVRLFLPTPEAMRIRADITRDFLSYAYKLKKESTISAETIDVDTDSTDDSATT